VGESMRFRTNKAVPDFALLYILSNLFFNSLTCFSNHSFSCFVTYNGPPPWTNSVGQVLQPWRNTTLLFLRATTVAQR